MPHFLQLRYECCKTIGICFAKEPIPIFICMPIENSKTLIINMIKNLFYMVSGEILYSVSNNLKSLIVFDIYDEQYH